MIHDDEVFRKGVVSRPFSLSSKGEMTAGSEAKWWLSFTASKSWA